MIVCSLWMAPTFENFFWRPEIFLVPALLEASLNTYHLANLLFPPPLILSVRGDVKLFDFGLARGKEEMKNSIALPRNHTKLRQTINSTTKKFPKQECWRTIRFSCRGKRVRLATWPRRWLRSNRTMRPSTFTLSLSWHGRFSRWTPPTRIIRLLGTIISSSKRADARS